MRTRWLFLLCLFAVFAASQSAWAQCPPTDPTYVFPGPLANYSVDEGSTTGVAVLGGGPLFEWDTDCDGVTTSRGDMIGPSSFVYTAKNRDGDSAARLCVRSFNPTCPAAQRFSAQVRADVRIRNVAPTITTNLLPIAAVGRVFSFTLAATDPANPPVAASVLDAFMWSATGLPMGLSINAATGAITGTPAAGTAGSYTVTVTVADGDGGTNSRMYTLTVAPMGTNQPCPTPVIAGTIGAMLTVNEGSTLMMTARIPDGGGCSCRVAWDLGCDGSVDVVDGSVNVSAVGLDGPAGAIRVCALAIPVPSSGSLVVCAESPSAFGPVTVQNVAPTITTAVLPGGTVGTAYVAQMLASDPANPPNASGILDPFVWNATGLPPGLAIDSTTGVVSGTPTMAGSFMVSITVSDVDGGTATAHMIIVISSVASLTCPTPALITAGGAAPSVDEGGSVILNATLGIAPCGCSIQWDVGCDGTRDGSGSSFTLSGVDRDGPADTVRVCIRGVPGALAVCNTASGDSANGVSVRNVAPTITTGSLPSGMLGSAYTATVTATDPANPPVASMTRDPIAWSATGLPPGITINAMTGVISGTPTVAGGAAARCYDVTVTANDGDGGVTNRDLQLCLTAVAMMNCPAARPNADGPYSVNEGATASIAVAFGAGGACGCTIEWDFDCNGTADGTGTSITYDARGLDGPSTRNVCWISRPTAMGPCNSASASSNNNVRILNVAPTITTASIPDAMVGTRYMTTIAATDPANPPVAMTTQDPFTWSLMGQPAWISIDASTGVISASPPAGTQGMSFTFTVIVEDGDGGRTTRMLTLRVSPAVVMDAGVDGGAIADAGSDAAVVVDATVTPDAAMDATVTADGATVDASTADSAVSADGAVAADSASDATVNPDTSVTSDGSLNGDSGARPDASRADSGQPPFGLSGDGACSCRAAGHSGSSSNGRLAMVIAGVAMVIAARRKRQR